MFKRTDIASSKGHEGATGTPPGLLLVVSSPSGAGKTTLSRRLLRTHDELRFSVSYTTRPQRRGEQNGVDYHFVSDEEFDRMIAADAFAEWCWVHGRRYGTALSSVGSALLAGQQILLDVDYQGAAKLAARFPVEARLVFILPPSFAVLAERLRGRGTDAASIVEQRLQKAREELRQFRQYHYLVMNSEVDRAFAELDAIFLVEQARVRGQSGTLPLPLQELAASCRLEARTPLAEQVLASAEREALFPSLPTACAVDQ
jgi:guanylate kinase